MATKKPAPAPAPSRAASAAPAADTKTASAADPKAAPKKKRALPMVLAVLLSLCAAGAGGWHYLRLKEAQAAPSPQAASRKTEPVFLPLEQFTVNLTTVTIDRFLQIGITLEVANAEAGERLKRYLPVVRSRILLLLASKTAEDLASPAGKQKLVEDILRETRAPLPDAGGASKGVENAHFSSFVVQ